MGGVLVGGTGLIVGAGVFVAGTEVLAGVAVGVGEPPPDLGVFVGLGVWVGFDATEPLPEPSFAHRCASRCGQAALALLDRLIAVKATSGKAARMRPAVFTGHRQA